MAQAEADTVAAVADEVTRLILIFNAKGIRRRDATRHADWKSAIQQTRSLRYELAQFQCSLVFF